MTQKTGVFLWYRNVREPFYQEQSPFPVAHFSINFALYGVLQNFPLTVLVAYAYETFERLAEPLMKSGRAGSLLPNWTQTEQWDDSWIGDPAMSVLAAGFLSLVYTYQDWFSAAWQPHLGWRLIPLLATMAASWMFESREKTFVDHQRRGPSSKGSVHTEIFYVLVAHTVAVSAVYVPAIFQCTDAQSDQRRDAWWNYLILLSTVLSVSLVALPKTRSVSVYRRVFLTGLVFWIAILLKSLGRVLGGVPPP